MPYLCGCPRKEQQAGRKAWEGAVGHNVGVAQGAILVLDFFSILKLTFCSSHPVGVFNTISWGNDSQNISPVQIFLLDLRSNCLLDTSIWICNRYLQLNRSQSKVEFLPLSPQPCLSNLCYSYSLTHSQLMTHHPSCYWDQNLESFWFSSFSLHIQSVKKFLL